MSLMLHSGGLFSEIPCRNFEKPKERKCLYCGNTFIPKSPSHCCCTAEEAKLLIQRQKKVNYENIFSN